LGFLIQHLDFSSSTTLLMSDDDCNGELSAAKPQNWYAIDNNKTEITNFHAC
jgi:hypothetical protein